MSPYEITFSKKPPNIPHYLAGDSNVAAVDEWCGSNVFQVYFDDAKDLSQESRVKQVSRIKESFNQSKFQESRLK